MSVPTSINSGVGGGGAASTAGGATVAASAGFPYWIVLILLGFTMIFLSLILLRLGKRATGRVIR